MSKGYDAEDDRIALVDLDGTVADYDKALGEGMRKLQAPNEPPYKDRYSGGVEPDYIEARRKVITSVPGFWTGLEKLSLGFEVVEEMEKLGFGIHVLTKGPKKNSLAWMEKNDWCLKHLPEATVTVTGRKSLVYGRVLFDDFPPYFLSWLKVRPRGLVICLAHPWNEGFAKGGDQAHPNVLRYDGTDLLELREALRRSYERGPGEGLQALQALSSGA
jgi:5'-nucleotidase